MSRECTAKIQASRAKGKSHDRGHPPHFSLPPRAVSPVDVAMETRGSKRIKRSADVDAATPGCLGCADLKTELAQLKTELSELKTELGDYKAVCEANARTLSELRSSCRAVCQKATLVCCWAR